MREISLDELSKKRNEYYQNVKFTISRRALNKTKISDLTHVSEQYPKTRNYFSNTIKTMEATNQMSSGRCWIFAGLNILREKVAKRYNIQDFELSQNYVAFYDKLEKCNYFIESIIKLRSVNKFDRTFNLILSNGITDGGQWDMFVNIIKKYGVVPKDAFPETYQSSNTKEIDAIINRYLRKTACIIRKGVNTDIDGIKAKAMQEIYEILCTAFGVPPEVIDFEYEDKDENYHVYKNITPVDFLKDFVEFEYNDYVSIINAPTRDKPFNETYTVQYLGNVIEGKPIKYLNLELKRFKELVVSQIVDGEVVWFGSDCSQYQDRTGGVWDDETFDENTLFQIDDNMSKDEMLDYWESAMNHAMLLTGVNIEGGITTKWKIENSWGRDHAFKGYHVATDSWFNKYVYQAVINKKYLTEEELELLKMEPNKLDLWDPMGTLAD